MFSLRAENLGKRFHRTWIFKDISFQLKPGDHMLVTGANGSGKSTLLRVIAGQLSQTRGILEIINGKRKIDYERFYHFISWSGPYMELYPDLTLQEMIRLHFRFREPLIPRTDIMQALKLETEANKLLRHFSSGMVQRVKAGLAILSQSKILLLDEATSNMDAQNSAYILDLMREYAGDRILIFASNKQDEFDGFSQRLDLGR